MATDRRVYAQWVVAENACNDDGVIVLSLNNTGRLTSRIHQAL